MKIRSGFVSNSSSSSFIIGIGLIRPGKEKEVEEIFGKHQIKSVMEEICDQKQGGYWHELNMRNGGDSFSCDSFSGIRSAEICGIFDEMKKQGVDDLKLVYMYEYGDDPEYDDEAWDYNYDDFNDPEAFNETMQEKYNLLNNNRDLFLQGEAACGAGYNG